MPIIKIAFWAISATLILGCVALKPDQRRIEKELPNYQLVKECLSPELDFQVYIRRPITSPEDIYRKDAIIMMTLKEPPFSIPGVYFPFTILWFHPIERDPESADLIERTFTDFPTIFRGKNIEARKRGATKSDEELEAEFREFLKNLVPLSQKVSGSVIFPLFDALFSSYRNVVDRCIYHF